MNEVPQKKRCDPETAEVSVRHAHMRVLAEQAMANPDFVADLQDTMQAFQHSDKENWPVYDDERL